HILEEGDRQIGDPEHERVDLNDSPGPACTWDTCACSHLRFSPCTVLPVPSGYPDVRGLSGSGSPSARDTQHSMTGRTATRSMSRRLSISLWKRFGPAPLQSATTGVARSCLRATCSSP